MPSEVGSSTSGTLDENETIRYELQTSIVIGMSVRICVSEGYITAYASLSVPNPNSAFYDWTLEVEHDSSKSENCDFFFVDPNPPDEQCQTPATTSASRANHTVFVALSGKLQQNVFTLESAYSNIGKYNIVCITLYPGTTICRPVAKSSNGWVQSQ